MPTHKLQSRSGILDALIFIPCSVELFCGNTDVCKNASLGGISANTSTSDI
jgi:hypothetical protein